MLSKKYLLFALLYVFLLGDTIYSFFEYYYAPIDGDLATGVIPSPDVQKVLDDPLGFKMLKSNEKKVNPNRFFLILR